MPLKRYLAEEVALDHVDGHITRREALRRLGLLGFGAVASGSILAACAQEEGSQERQAATTPGASPPGPTPLEVEDITFPGPGGRDTLGVYAAADDPKGNVLVIHENRGLTEHVRQVAGRFAADGYAALAVDLLSEQGGTSKAGDEAAIQGMLGNADKEALVADMKAAIDELEKRNPDVKVAAIGFCFGGGMVWQLLDSGEERLAAAAPFYGTTPDDGADFSRSKNAAVLGVYAELDDRVNATRETAKAALEKADLEHEIKVYPGVDHAFFNSTGERYNAEQAQKAYDDVRAWFEEHLA